MKTEKQPTKSNQSPEEMKMETFPGAFRSWANAWCMECMDRGTQPSRSNGSKAGRDARDEA